MKASGQRPDDDAMFEVPYSRLRELTEDVRSLRVRVAELEADNADLHQNRFPKTWQGFRDFFDEQYPDDVFPDDGRDLGPSFVVAARRLASVEARIAAVEAAVNSCQVDGDEHDDWVWRDEANRKLADVRAAVAGVAA